MCLKDIDNYLWNQKSSVSRAVAPNAISYIALLRLVAKLDVMFMNQLE